MAKSLVEQLNEIKEKIKKEERVVIKDALAIFDLMESYIEEIEEARGRLIPGEMLSEQLNNVVIVYRNVRQIFENQRIQVEQVTGEVMPPMPLPTPVSNT